MSDQNNDQQPIVIVDELASELVSQNITTRRKMRSLLFHVLYAADAFDYETSAVEISRNFNREYDTNIDLEGDIITTVNDIAKRRDELDEQIVPFLENWKFDRIGRCTLLVLRYAIWEMLYTTTPHSIVINEAIELAKCFAEQDSYKFVNGILDKIHIDITPEESSDEESDL
ncbi:MAG: transcription antitermination factor NusB [Candidatus Chromulinivorax sp.]|nr:transcription antitermination factor NusB [Candidatus Chromulinivorax sp.]